MLGVAPALGRGFLPEEEVSGRDRVVVLSHAFWAGRMGGDSAIVGRMLTLDGIPHEVVGVMPADFRFPDDGGGRAVESAGIRPVGAAEPGGAALQRHGAPRARSSPGRRPRGARRGGVPAGRRASPVQRRLDRDLAPRRARRSPPGAGPPSPCCSRTVALVLLLACANVGHLFLARMLDRDRELAIRVALGGAPARLIRLLVIECLTVALLGALLGLGLAAWAVPLVQAIDPGLLPGWRAAALDRRVVGFALALLIPVTLLCGVLPALRAIGLDRRVPLAGSGERLTGGRTRARVRRALIVGEVALSGVLLVAAGLHLRSLARLQQEDPGFDAEHVLAGTLFLSGTRYDADENQAGFFGELIQRLQQRPGVVAAGAVTTLPMNPVGIDYDLPFSPDGTPPPPTADRTEVDFRVVAGDYFEAIGVPVLRGRALDDSDRADAARVILVNRALADRFFPGENPVGRQVWVGGGIGSATVVGMVGDVRHRSLALSPKAEMYVPFRQYPHGGMTIVLRGAGDPATLVRTLKDEIYGLDPAQPLTDLVTLSELLAGSVSPQRFTMMLLGGFAVLALLLAGIGVYGVIAYAVGQRTREIGIRMALGAAGREIRRAVILPAVGLAALGVALGSAGALLLGRLVAPDLYQISPHDPLTFAVVAGILLAAAWAACALPARRASRLDPLIALRSE